MKRHTISSNKLVFITGASSGIGLEAAKFLSTRGFTVLAGVRSDQDFEGVNSISPHLKAIKVDVTNSDSIDEAVKVIESGFHFSEYFALINNAGVVKAGPLECIAIEDLQAQLEVNVTSQVRVTQKLLPLLRQAKTSRLIFTGSNSGVFTIPLNAPYAASKHAIEAIADGFRRELSTNSSIRVCLLQPGQIKTPIWKKSLDIAQKAQKKYPSQMIDYYGKLIDIIEKRVEKTDKENAANPTVVSQAIYHALTSSRPHTRYSMGTGSRFTQLFLKRLPDKLADKVLKYLLSY